MSNRLVQSHFSKFSPQKGADILPSRKLPEARQGVGPKPSHGCPNRADYKWAQFFALALVIAACSLAGCNVGDAPAGPSAAEYQQSLDKMSPEQHIKWIEASPLNPNEKAKQIAAIKAKAGLK